MNDSTPVSPPPIVATPATTQARVVSVEKLPLELEQSPEPIRVEGTVVAADATTKTVTINTPQGDVVLHMATPLPVHAQVRLEIAEQKAAVTVLRVRAELSAESYRALDSQKPLAGPPLDPAERPAPVMQAGAVYIAVQIASQSRDPLPSPYTALPPDVKEAVQTLIAQAKEVSLLQNPQALAALREVLNEAPRSENPMPSPLATVMAAPQNSDETQSLLNIIHAQIQSHLQPSKPVVSQEKPFSFAPLKLFLDLFSSDDRGVQLSQEKAPLIQKVLQTVYGDSALPLPQNFFEVRVDQIFSKASAPQEISQRLAQKPNLVPAMVEAIVPGGFPVIGSSAGSFVLRQKVDVSPGTFLTLELSGLTSQQVLNHLQGLDVTQMPTNTAVQSTATNAATLPYVFDPRLDFAWPALQDVLNLGINEQAASPLAAATAALRASLPAPTQKLAPSTLFFLAALRIGTLEAWGGERLLTSLRQSGARDLADRLSNDFARLSTQSREVSVDGWRQFTLPFLQEDKLGQMTLFTRQQAQEDETAEGSENKRSTRFLLNVSFSKLGAVQVDGLASKDKLDVILRTQEKLPALDRQALLRRYHEVLEQIGHGGSLAFQSRAQAWVEVPTATHGQTIA